MIDDPVRELKVRAEILHHAASTGDARALSRLRALPELKKAESDALVRAAAEMKRKHWLAVVAVEAGFVGWEHAKCVLGGDAHDAGFGKLLSGSGRGAFLNHWFAIYEEARAVQDELLATGERRYLLAYQRQCFLTEQGYIESLGLDPDDADWRAIGWDWVRPRSTAARGRLYGKLLLAGREGGDKTTV
jgi:hypothetical protein